MLRSRKQEKRIAEKFVSLKMKCLQTDRSFHHLMYRQKSREFNYRVSSEQDVYSFNFVCIFEYSTGKILSMGIIR